MARPAHPTKEIDEALDYAASKDWTIEKVDPVLMHGADEVPLPHEVDGCQVSIYSTPRNPQNHAKQLKRAISVRLQADLTAGGKSGDVRAVIASGIDPNIEDFENAFLEAGCDDATIARFSVAC